MIIEGLLAILLLLSGIQLWFIVRRKKNSDAIEKFKSLETSVLKFDITLERMEKVIREEFQRNREESAGSGKESRNELSKALKIFSDANTENNKNLNELLYKKFSDLINRQTDLNRQSEENIKGIKETTEKYLKEIRTDNNLQLTEMRKTVDEKLQTTLEKRLGESFKQVSERLEEVHKGLGEMQTIATGVGDLKKVLSNVKTRGILGEYQLENILEQLLAPGQYTKNVATKKGSAARIEFAVKLPGKESDEPVMLPIDSKFPIEPYELLLRAYDLGDKSKIERCKIDLFRVVESFAKDISEKYLDPPNTTDFAIMFLPIESLYAEVLRDPGNFERLQRKHHITITGPSTLSAFLNSLQMGFRTLAIRKRTSEVWKILETVKTEFEKFSNHLEKVESQLSTASKSLGELRSTRTNVMNRQLREISDSSANNNTLTSEVPPLLTDKPESEDLL